MILFWILWGFDAILSLIVLYFFLTGLNDGSVSSSNMVMWLIILLIIAAIMGGSLKLKLAKQVVLANILLFLFAVPGLLYGLFLLIAITGNVRWN